MLISTASLLLLSGVALGLVDYSAMWLPVNAVSMTGWQILLVYRLIKMQELFDLKKAFKAKSAADTSSDNKSRLTRMMLEDYFRLQRPFADPHFMLSDLAEAMAVNRSEMSGFINKTYGMNFNRFVNRWRLSEFRRLMTLPANMRKNPYKILQLAGFTDSRHYLRALRAEYEAENGTGQGTENETNLQKSNPKTKAV